HSGRITKGSGYPARFPFIDLAEISSGGGSIAWVDQGKALRVGPISAGAEPGPACYGQKGEDPTITDANLVLGRLNPKGLLDKTFKIYPELAEQSILKKIAEPLKLDVVESALGIIKIANNNMSRILRIVTVERGLDPREFILNAFGGAGPLHACALAEELKINEMIIPSNPGLFSAMGLLFTDAKHTYVKSIRKELLDIDYSNLEQSYQGLETQGSKVLTEEGFKPKNIIHKRFVDLRYVGQGFELLIPIDGINLENKGCKDQILKRFIEKHLSIYGYILDDEEVEMVNIRINSLGLIKKPKLVKITEGTSKPKDEAQSSTREAYFEEYKGFKQTPIFSREKLLAKNEIKGPAIIEQYDSTTVVHPNWKASIDRFGLLHLTRM
ncbi:MAG: hydantoinase/oxoprolinase family protein, partial [Asgard group archaeon]|nr:hydantoinase/oxoprolinase family protein [Asgard group archaeon]